MLAFDAENPFPLLPEGSHTYREAQEHSAQVDAWLGLRTAEIEASLAPRPSEREQNPWIGLPTQALLTPYTELRALLHRLSPRPGETVVDLGAGYGRMGFVLARHHPEARFVGYELLEPRVREGRRCLESFARAGAGLAELVQADLSDPGFSPAEAEFYFLYDFGSRAAIRKALEDLRRIARGRALTVVGRGRASRDAIEREHPWLSQVSEPEHFAHYSIYRSAA